jgi:hypothetical protein
MVAVPVVARITAGAPGAVDAARTMAVARAVPRITAGAPGAVGAARIMVAVPVVARIMAAVQADVAPMMPMVADPALAVHLMAMMQVQVLAARRMARILVAGRKRVRKIRAPHK